MRQADRSETDALVKRVELTWQSPVGPPQICFAEYGNYRVSILKWKGEWPQYSWLIKRGSHRVIHRSGFGNKWPTGYADTEEEAKANATAALDKLINGAVDDPPVPVTESVTPEVGWSGPFRIPDPNTGHGYWLSYLVRLENGVWVEAMDYGYHKQFYWAVYHDRPKTHTAMSRRGHPVFSGMRPTLKAAQKTGLAKGRKMRGEFPRLPEDLTPRAYADVLS